MSDGIEKDEIDSLLYKRYTDHEVNHADRYIDHFLEQYRVYIHIFNSFSERRLKSNEFFLAINTAIMGILGYLQLKGPIEKPIFFLMVPFVGIAICYCWHEMIHSYRQLDRAKFKVIHSVEKKLPIALYETEWELLGKGKDKKKYLPISNLEMIIPLIFIILYILIFVSNFPWGNLTSLIR